MSGVKDSDLFAGCRVVLLKRKVNIEIKPSKARREIDVREPFPRKLGKTWQPTNFIEFHFATDKIDLQTASNSSTFENLSRVNHLKS